MPDVLIPVGNAGQHAQLKLVEQADGTHAVAAAVVSGGGAAAALQRVTVFDEATTVGPSAIYAGARGLDISVTFVFVQAAPGDTANIRLEVRNASEGPWCEFDSVFLSDVQEEVARDYRLPFIEFRFRITQIATGANVTLTMAR